MYRASADIDVVIDPTSVQLEALARTLEPGFYVSRSAMAEALSSRSTFKAVHDETSFKIDFIKGTAPFDAEELRRSIRREVGGERGHVGVLRFCVGHHASSAITVSRLYDLEAGSRLP